MSLIRLVANALVIPGDDAIQDPHFLVVLLWVWASKFGLDLVRTLQDLVEPLQVLLTPRGVKIITVHGHGQVSGWVPEIAG